MSSFSVCPWTVAHQASLSMGFSRQEYWSGLPFPASGDHSHPGMEPRSHTLQVDALPSDSPGKPQFFFNTYIVAFNLLVSYPYLLLSHACFLYYLSSTFHYSIPELLIVCETPFHFWKHRTLTSHSLITIFYSSRSLLS